MKILVSIILCLWLTLTTGFAQSFPNIDLRQIPNNCAFVTGLGTEPSNQFADQSGDGCSTTPWFVSHGTPDISGSQFSPDRFVFIGSATKCTDCGGKRSEGVSYRQTFFKNKWYKLNISYRGNVDKFNIILGNSVPIAPPPTFNTPRSADVPNVTDKQIIFDGSGNVSPFITKDFVFVPKNVFLHNQYIL